MKLTEKTKAYLTAVSLIIITAFATAYFGGLFSKKEKPAINNSSTNQVSNDSTVISGTQNNAGRDNIITENKKVIEVKPGGTGFFDSAKQINNNTYTGIEQRHIDLGLMEKIIDSIPSKNTVIEIACGGGMEGENLGREMSKFLIDKGYSKPILSPWAMTGNYEIIEYSLDKDSVFRIGIHPRANVPQIQ